ncbi:DUF222 domain-containing protein [Occultella glacieicola]|uniref:DUF222 domain-containing protein n=1 Tax=Occultella glacieicola TaxID=2518684 RepID=A0ABY2E0K6_9MICO|nr:HNH endonuclease signature motif containing protein [Occultella glacieicola]TDE91479.1 DUF222 domain-containing protein [Occultella glacieicola]
MYEAGGGDRVGGGPGERGEPDTLPWGESDLATDPPWLEAAGAADPAWLEATYALFDRAIEAPVVDPQDPEGLEGGFGDPTEMAPVNLEALAARAVPDSFTLSELERLHGPVRDLSGVDEYDLVELAALWRQLESVCAAGVRAAAAELAGRVPMSMDKPAVLDRRTNFRTSIAAEEIAPRLGCSKREANRLINVGHLQDTIAAPTGDALAAGAIDAVKADLIATAVAVLDAEPALAVQTQILPKASGWTRHRLQKEIATAVAEADPAHLTQRARNASQKRYVSRARMVADGMATHTLYWPAADALTLDLTLDAAAATAKAAGDPRTLEQLRPDILADLAAHHLTTGRIGPHPAPPDHTAGAGDPATASTADTVSEQPVGAAASTITAPAPAADPTSADHPVPISGDTGRGPTSTPTDPAPAPDSKPEADPNPKPEANPDPKPEAEPDTDTDTDSVVGAGAARSAPGAGAGADADSGSDAGAGADAGAADGPGPGDPNLAVPADRGAPRTWPIGILGGHKAQIVVHVPLSTLLGGDEPGNIEHLGPVPADVAAAIAAGGTWTRLVTDPLTDTVVDYGITRYHPPQNMIDRIKANEPHCISPGCSASARQTELNHRIPYPVGPTRDDNLDPMCRRDHILVTHGKFSYERASDGTITWHTATGHTYQRDPDGRITKLHRDLHLPANHGKTRYHSPTPPPDPDEEPPF